MVVCTDKHLYVAMGGNDFENLRFLMAIMQHFVGNAEWSVVNAASVAGMRQLPRNTSVLFQRVEYKDSIMQLAEPVEAKKLRALRDNMASIGICDYALIAVKVGERLNKDVVNAIRFLAVAYALATTKESIQVG